MSSSAPTSELTVFRPSQGRTARIRAARVYVDGQMVGRLLPEESVRLALPAGEHTLRARMDWTGSPVERLTLGSEPLTMSVLITGNMVSRSRYMRWCTGRITPTPSENQKVFRASLAYTMLLVLPLIVLLALR